MIVGTYNWLTDLDLATETDIPTTAAGYEAESLWQGGTARAWRSASALFQSFEFRLATDRPVDLVGLFGVQVSGGETISSITIGHKATWGSGTSTSVGTMDLNDRGDGALWLPVPIADETWTISFLLSGAAPLTIGGIWMGEADVLSKAPAALSLRRDGNSIVNVSEAKTRRSTRLASPTRTFSIGWPSLEEGDSTEILGVFDELSGSGSPCVLIPDETDLTAAYFGRISDSIEASVDPSQLWTGHGFSFEEDGRAIGG